MKKLAMLIITLVLFAGCDAGENEMLNADSNIETTLFVTSEPITDIDPATPTHTAEPTPTITPALTASPTTEPTATTTQKPTAKPTASPVPTPTPEPTPAPTPAPEYIVISSSIRSGALQGINEGRDEEGNPPASLSGSLNSKAEAHAIVMAKADSLYHSGMGYVESVRSGANIGGWAEGYSASCHATQLATDAGITQIGVGSAKSADGTVYTCIIGN